MEKTLQWLWCWQKRTLSLCSWPLLLASLSWAISRFGSWLLESSLIFLFFSFIYLLIYLFGCTSECYEGIKTPLKRQEESRKGDILLHSQPSLTETWPSSYLKTCLEHANKPGVQDKSQKSLIYLKSRCQAEACTQLPGHKGSWKWMSELKVKILISKTLLWKRSLLDFTCQSVTPSKVSHLNTITLGLAVNIFGENKYSVHNNTHMFNE